MGSEYDTAGSRAGQGQAAHGVSGGHSSGGGGLHGQGPLIRVQRLRRAAQMPRYAHQGPNGDLAADLFAAEPVTLAAVGEPGATRAITTGLALEFPSTHGALIEDRSGLALRGITTLAGVIDSGYRGELKVVLTNLAPEPQEVMPGHRIAQLRVVERIQAVFEETDELEETPRGTAGFGSTGR